MRNINNLRYADDTTLMAESEEELKSLLMRVEVDGLVAIKLVELKKKRLPGEISITSHKQMTPPLWQKAKKK